MPSLKARDLWKFSQVPILTNKKMAWWVAGSWTHGYVSIQISKWVGYSLPVPKLKRKSGVRWSLFTWPTVTSWKTLRGVLLGSKSTWNKLHLVWSNGVNFGIGSVENVEGRNQWKTSWWYFNPSETYAWQKKIDDLPRVEWYISKKIFETTT